MQAHTFPVAETDGEVSLRFQARNCLLHKTLRVKKVRTRTFPVAETDSEVSIRFQARTCPLGQKGLEKERGQHDGSACAKGGGWVYQEGAKSI